jgi:hypothetical protein
MAKNEKDAYKRVKEDGLENGEYGDEIFWNDAEPSYKINKKTPSKSEGVFVEEKEDEE